MKRIIEVWALAVSAVASIAGVIGCYIVLPYRVSALETEQTVMKATFTNTVASDHELLVRIDERVKQLQERYYPK